MIAKKISLRNKITLGVVLIVLFLGTSVSLVVKSILPDVLKQQLKNKGTFIARSLSARSVDSILIENWFDLKYFVEDERKIDTDVVYAFITDSGNNVLAHTFKGGFPIELKSVNSAISSGISNIQLLDTGKGFVYDIAAPILAKDKIVGTVRIGLTEKNIQKIINNTLALIIGITILTVFISVLIGSGLAGLIVKPVKELHYATEKMMKGNLDVRVRVSPVPCWKVEKCGMKNCPAYKKTDIPCWYVTGTMCKGGIQGTYAQKIEECKKCKVYNSYVGDEIEKLAISFNEMARNLEKDISKRKLAESRVFKVEERYRELWNNAPVSYHTLDNNGVLTQVNRTEADLLGYTVEEMTGKPIFEFILPEQREEARDRFLEKMSGDHVQKSKNRIYVKKDGTKIHVSIDDVLEFDKGGRAIGVRTTMMDITERQKAEEDLQYKAMFENLVTSISTKFINLEPGEIDKAFNHALCQIGEFAGIDRSYMFLFSEDRTTMDNTHEWCADGIEPQVKRLKDVSAADFPWLMNKLMNREVVHISPVLGLPSEAKAEKEKLGKGQVKSLIIVPAFFGGNLVGILGFDSVKKQKTWPEEIILLLKIVGEIFANALQHKTAQEALTAEKERLAITLKNIGDGVIATDIKNKVVLLNKVAEELTGWPQEEAVGKSIGEVFQLYNEKNHKCYSGPVKRMLKLNNASGFENQEILICRGGTERIIACSSSEIRDKHSKVIGTVIVFNDVTEKLKTERELTKIQKLESLGVLAGGIAHDFNNILTTIVGNVSLAKSHLKTGSYTFEVLTEAEKNFVRAKDLTKQFLTFSKGGTPVKAPLLIAELIQDSVNFAMQGTTNLKCEYSIPDNLHSVEADEGQINQVIGNLIINAEQAMPEGGVIEIFAKNVTLGQRDVPPLKGGKYVMISFKDHGIGIPKKHLHQIFDPYFTTKQEGSGLGLANVYSIVRNHGGYITVDSVLGVETAFTIYLPVLSAGKIKAKAPGGKPAVAGKGKVLIMDDEQDVRDVVGAMLNRIGYNVDFAGDGGKAVELYKKAGKSKKPFDVVIMDLTIAGGISGKEAIKQFKKIDPEVKAIVSSGYSNDPVMVRYKRYGFKGVLAKPYEIKELNRVLAKVIKNKKK